MSQGREVWRWIAWFIGDGAERNGGRGRVTVGGLLQS